MKRIILIITLLCLTLIQGCGSGEKGVTRYGTSFDPAPAPLPDSWPSYIQPKEWQSAGTLPKTKNGIYDLAAAVWQNNLYVSGGFGSGPDVYTQEIYIYRIRTDFTLEAYKVSRLPDKMLTLVTPTGEKVLAQVEGLDGHAMFASNGYLYVVGGKFQYQRTDCYPTVAPSCFEPTPTAWNRSLFYAPIVSDGTVGTWTEIPLPSTTGPYTPGVAVYNNTLYIAGGWNGDLQDNSDGVVSVSLMPDGGLGSWRNEQNLPRGISKHAVVAANGYLYVLGGNTGAAVSQDGYSQGFEKSVYYAAINPDGTLEGWTPAQSLPSTWIDHRAVAVQDFLLVIGGRDVNEYYDPTGGGQYYYQYKFHKTILISRVLADGSLTPWQGYKDLPADLYNDVLGQYGILRHAVATTPGLVPNALYLVGGSTGQDPELESCEGGICSAPYRRVKGIYVLNFMP